MPFAFDTASTWLFCGIPARARDLQGRSLPRSEPKIFLGFRLAPVVFDTRKSGEKDLAAGRLTASSISRGAACVCRRNVDVRQLVKAYLKRIEAYDKKGPVINAIITLSEKALDEARQRDAERKSGNVRGPLHGSRWRTGYEAGTEGYFVADRCGCQGATGVTI